MKLQNEYGVLTKDERLSLFLQATSRGDTQETQAIIAASPRVNVTMIDFSPDVNALINATILHCLGQANLLTAITHLWEDRDDDKSFLCAVLNAKHYLVKEEAFRPICKENGFDYDNLLTMWGDYVYVNTNPELYDWVKKLASTKNEYKVSPNSTVVLTVPTIGEQMSEHRKTIAHFRELFG